MLDNIENNDKKINGDMTVYHKKKFSKIFTIILYFVIFALGYEAATISYTRSFGKVPAETINKMNKIETIIDENYYKDYSKGKLYEYVESFMVYGLEDPFSYYLDEEGESEFNDTIDGSYVGVGLTLTPSDSGEIKVIAPFDGSPAQAAGIMKNDIIYKVNGNIYSYEEIDKAISLMKGKEGETVTLEIKREGSNNFTCTLTKSKIIYQSVVSSMLTENILYLRISRFDVNTYDAFKEELYKHPFTSETNLIIDLRDNPGGTVVTSVNIADLFLDKGVIITEKYKNRKDIVEKASKGCIDIKYPIVILTNNSTASASEILAGSLKDHKKAITIGEKTYGKGLINRYFKIDNKSSIVLSVAEYLTPSGKSIHKSGISPDIEVISNINKSVLTMEYEEDNQLQAAVEYINSQLITE